MSNQVTSLATINHRLADQPRTTSISVQKIIEESPPYESLCPDDESTNKNPTGEMSTSSLEPEAHGAGYLELVPRHYLLELWRWAPEFGADSDE